MLRTVIDAAPRPRALACPPAQHQLDRLPGVDLDDRKHLPGQVQIEIGEPLHRAAGARERGALERLGAECTNRPEVAAARVQRGYGEGPGRSRTGLPGPQGAGSCGSGP